MTTWIKIKDDEGSEVNPAPKTGELLDLWSRLCDHRFADVSWSQADNNWLDEGGSVLVYERLDFTHWMLAPKAPDA